MEADSVRMVSVPLPFTTVAQCPDGLCPLPCLTCECPLDIHQPDAETPDRMLATCDECKDWYLIYCDAGTTGVLVVRLPGPGPFLGAPPG